jgi:hypothetical protein
LLILLTGWVTPAVAQSESGSATIVGVTKDQAAPSFPA